MGLKEVEEEIRRNIRSNVNSIKSEKKNEADQILAEANERINQLEIERKTEISTISKGITLALSMMESKKIDLETRKKLLDEVYGKLTDKIYSIKGKERDDLINKLIKKGKNEIDVGVVYSNEEDSAKVKKICGKGIKFGGEINTRGGVILETKTGEVSVDYTFESLLNDFRRNTSADVAMELFKK